MNILSFDTSAAACSVAVSRDDTCLATVSEEMRRGQSERLIPLIQQMLAEAGWKPSDIDLIATTTGPGAFTGIRIGLSAARALGLALEIPVIGLTTTRVVAMAQKNTDKRPILAAIETKRADIYVDLLSSDGVSKDGPKALPLDQAVALAGASKVLLCGDGATRLVPLLDEVGVDHVMEAGPSLPNPVTIAQIGLKDFRSLGAKAFVTPPQPLYIRPPDASLPKPNPRAAL